ncbi:LacI family DNA-binding transcriptional regulator [Mameliella sediminis]|uniref:LacI family DNA-binding transcriptional regulator n=1 Tax=Mameliella sediminis TaxID=2836866 RepID=UPI001C454828|nr:LacI family DNA-binding transcriptional regulator [Mameliella sediminis]MBY6116958.1 LacI family DNA-binding transcriptional regulator [Antarctobacter heliothermus]MBY6146711.1 LacI family DNA-binding transcriptional regulator [Mameliella alba]MCA0956983.1 LacI family DNA-binding transcriptional regulator [Mameliella alba]
MTQGGTPTLPRKDRGSKPTQRTIADATGFAVTTVSKALADDPSIAKKTRDTIQKTARDLGYVPDRAAQRLRTGRTNVISLVLDPHSELLGFGASMIEGISEVLRPTRYHLTIMQYQLSEDPLAPIDYILRNGLADGVIFARTEPRDPRVAFLTEAGFPFITHGRTLFTDHAWYDYDNTRFAEEAVRILADQGARSIGIVPPNPQFTFHRFMMDGFRSACQQRGCAALVSPGLDLNDPPERIYSGLMEWLSTRDRPEALICPGETPAMAAHAAQRDLGLEIPLLVKQTSPVFDFFRPRPLTIFEDIRAAGREMTQALQKLIAGDAPSGQQILAAPILSAAKIR